MKHVNTKRKIAILQNFNIVTNSELFNFLNLDFSNCEHFQLSFLKIIRLKSIMKLYLEKN